MSKALNFEFGGKAGTSALFAGIIREIEKSNGRAARDAIEAFSRSAIAKLPMEIIAPAMDANEVRDAAQRLVSEVFNLVDE